MYISIFSTHYKMKFNFTRYNYGKSKIPFTYIFPLHTNLFTEYAVIPSGGTLTDFTHQVRDVHEAFATRI